MLLRVPVSVLEEEGIARDDAAKLFSFVGAFAYAGSKPSDGHVGESMLSYGGMMPHQGGGSWLLTEGANHASQLDLNR